MALAAFGVAQDAGPALGGGRGVRQRRLGLRLDDGQWVTFRPIIAIAVEAGAIVALRTVLAGPFVAIVPGPLVTLRVARSFFARPVVPRPVVPGPIVTPGPIAAALAVTIAAVVAIAALVAGPLVALAVPLSIPGPLVALAFTVAVPRALVAAVLAGLPGFRRLAGFRGGRVSRLGLGLGAFVLEIDVEAGGEMVAAEDLAGRARGLHGAQQAEIVLSVLQVVLAKHAVAGRRGVARKLLVLFEDVLGVAADLRTLGPVGVECTIGVLSLRLAAAAPPAASATAIATALTFHTLEISHYFVTVSVSLRPDPVRIGLR